MDKLSNNSINKNSFNKERIFGVDPGRLALPSSGANADMLLYTITGLGPQMYYKTKEIPFSRDQFCSTRLILARVV